MVLGEPENPKHDQCSDVPSNIKDKGPEPREFYQSIRHLKISTYLKYKVFV